MKKSSKHRERVEKVKDFADKNKIFTFFAVILVIFLINNSLVRNTPSESPNYSNSSDNSDELNVSENSENAENSEETTDSEEISKKETWRFYFIDVIILVTVGGFFTAMIIRERRKTNSSL